MLEKIKLYFMARPDLVSFVLNGALGFALAAILIIAFFS
jgi:hypothetical protein